MMNELQIMQLCLILGTKTIDNLVYDKIGQ